MLRAAAVDDSPGFRRRFRITPGPSWVRSELEDDFHCMSVTIHHCDGVATQLEPMMERAPWNTCPGAIEQLQQTFTGIALDMFQARGEKRSNCTHLHDLATLAAAHAFDREQLIYDVLVSDPIDGQREAELRRNGTALLRLTQIDGRIVEPPEIAGCTLDKLGPWIASLEPSLQEPARVLRWGTMIAHGRTIPLAEQSDAMRMPVGNCYTFQSHVRVDARRIGKIRDFSGSAQPLDQRGAA